MPVVQEKLLITILAVRLEYDTNEIVSSLNRHFAYWVILGFHVGTKLEGLIGDERHPRSIDLLTHCEGCNSILRC